MRRILIALIVGAVLLLALASTASAAAPQVYMAKLSPLNASGFSGIAIFKANAGGSGNTRQMFSGAVLSALMLDSVPLTNRVVVVHGMTVNGTYDPTLPVACGPIVRIK